jgi:alpha-1,2-mannosyltransferase
MTFVTDVAVLVFYQLALAANAVVSLLQIGVWLRSGTLSLWHILYKSLLRAGLGMFFYMPMVHTVGRLLGHYLMSRSEMRRRMILNRIEAERQKELEVKQNGGEEDWEKIDKERSGQNTPEKDYRGIIGFFHPFCNAGGGGERVLWAAIRATQEKYPNATCVVYTGDHNVTKQQILEKVEARFNIKLNPMRVFFLYLSTRHWVLASTWPRFTLLGQSLGSILLALDAFSLLVPDVFIDTMGYAFALGVAKFCFPNMPTGAYVHYPTISTDMLGSLDMGEGKGVNAGAGKGLRGMVKREYWYLFARAYSWMGGSVDVVMANSTWTAAHIRSLWGPARRKRGKSGDIDIVFPPVAVNDILDKIKVNDESEKRREHNLVYVAQFRPEKNHKLIMEAFAEFIHNSPPEIDQLVAVTKLVLIGSVRDEHDARKVYELRLYAHELKIKEEVEFVCDAPWSGIVSWLEKSSIGLNGMWNEHFGMGCVEYQAGGLITVANDSGGPKHDIVIEYEGGPTGK